MHYHRNPVTVTLTAASGEAHLLFDEHCDTVRRSIAGWRYDIKAMSSRRLHQKGASYGKY